MCTIVQKTCTHRESEISSTQVLKPLKKRGLACRLPVLCSLNTEWRFFYVNYLPPNHKYKIHPSCFRHRPLRRLTACSTPSWAGQLRLEVWCQCFPLGIAFTMVISIRLLPTPWSDNTHQRGAAGRQEALRWLELLLAVLINGLI